MVFRIIELCSLISSKVLKLLLFPLRWREDFKMPSSLFNSSGFLNQQVERNVYLRFSWWTVHIYLRSGYDREWSCSSCELGRGGVRFLVFWPDIAVWSQLLQLTNQPSETSQLWKLFYFFHFAAVHLSVGRFYSFLAFTSCGSSWKYQLAKALVWECASTSYRWLVDLVRRSSRYRKSFFLAILHTIESIVHPKLIMSIPPKHRCLDPLNYSIKVIDRAAFPWVGHRQIKLETIILLKSLAQSCNFGRTLLLLLLFLKILYLILKLSYFIILGLSWR